MATRSLEGIQIRLLMSATVKNLLSDDPVRSATGALSSSFAPTLLDGTDIDEANRAWSYVSSLADAASLVIDLFDFGSLDSGSGAGKDIVGQAIALTEVVAILIRNTSEDTSDSDVPGDLEIEPDVTNGWTPIGTHTVANGGALAPGGLFLKVNTDTVGFLVTDASNHRIKLTANGGAVDFEVLVFGREG